MTVDKNPPTDPWDAPVRGTGAAGDADTVRIPVEDVVALEGSQEPPGPSPTPPEPAPPDPRDERIASLEAHLSEAEQALGQVRMAYRSREKELEAVKERLERDRERYLEKSRVQLLERLFEPLDNLGRSVQAAAAWPDKDDRTAALVGGLEMIQRQLMERLKELGLERIDPVGQAFDPALHEALATVPVETRAQDGRVLETWSAGYRAGATLLRPAKVVVGRLTGPGSRP
ncbi:MAG: nucleotide exchange factor GrpE [Deltaproteobacteria bacterium]|nr:nucleotide exchange factor GrpE [Deltaproteobacteria bacterium]